MIFLKSLRYILIVSFFLFGSLTYSQKLSTQDYIENYKDLAVEEMGKFKIPASIILAQGILESGNGNSKLAKRGKNHFGIKCHQGWTGKTIRWDDDARRECFRKYNSVSESYRDHSMFLSSRNRYSDLFSLNLTDYSGWARGLQKAGYATNNKYSRLLIKIIEENNLNDFDDLSIIELADNTPIVLPKAIVIPNDSDFEAIEISGNQRQIFTNNNVKYIFAEEGDSFQKIANDLDIYTWQVYKFNELKKKDPIVKGQMLYIQKKKSKNNLASHIVKENESMYSISQLYGMKLKSLYKKNKMKSGSKPKIGQKLKLK